LIWLPRVNAPGSRNSTWISATVFETKILGITSFSEGLAVFELEPRGKGAKEWNALVAALYPEML